MHIVRVYDLYAYNYMKVQRVPNTVSIILISNNIHYIYTNSDTLSA